MLSYMYAVLAITLCQIPWMKGHLNGSLSVA